MKGRGKMFIGAGVVNRWIEQGGHLGGEGRLMVESVCVCRLMTERHFDWLGCAENVMPLMKDCVTV